MAYGVPARTIIGFLLIVVGVAMLAAVFFNAYKASQEFTLEVESGGGLVEVLTENSRVLIELLIRIAFLAVALAAGSIVLGRGVDLVKGCPAQ